MRMVVITLRPLLRDIIAALLRTHTPDTVADLARRVPPDEVKSLMPDLIVVGLRKGECDRVGRKYATCIPTATVLVLSNDGRDACLHKGAKRSVLRGISADALESALADSMRGN
jgi:hypothetical protein